MKSTSYKILQLTDMHLFETPEQELLGLKTDESFRAVISLALQNHPEPDMICLTGDMSQDEMTPAYQRLAETLSAFHCPKYWVPGNHDDEAVLDSVFTAHHIQREKHIILENWQIIMLNTKKPEAVEGFLDKQEQDFLEHCLATYPEHPCLIFMHHHPLEVGSKWLDKLMLSNAPVFWDILSPYHQVKLVACGHVHQEYETLKDSIHFYSTPSTCFQFKRNSEQFAVEPSMPGYRLIELFSDGSFKTQVYRLKDFKLNLNGSMKGY